MITTYAVLDTVAALAQDIVLQVQELEPSEHFLDEVANLHGSSVITQGD